MGVYGVPVQYTLLAMHLLTRLSLHNKLGHSTWLCSACSCRPVIVYSSTNHTLHYLSTAETTNLQTALTAVTPAHGWTLD